MYAIGIVYAARRFSVVPCRYGGMVRGGRHTAPVRPEPYLIIKIVEAEDVAKRRNAQNPAARRRRGYCRIPRSDPGGHRRELRVDTRPAARGCPKEPGGRGL